MLVFPKRPNSVSPRFWPRTSSPSSSIFQTTKGDLKWLQCYKHYKLRLNFRHRHRCQIHPNPQTWVTWNLPWLIRGLWSEKKIRNALRDNSAPSRRLPTWSTLGTFSSSVAQRKASRPCASPKSICGSAGSIGIAGDPSKVGLQLGSVDHLVGINNWETPPCNI